MGGESMAWLGPAIGAGASLIGTLMTGTEDAPKPPKTPEMTAAEEDKDMEERLKRLAASRQNYGGTLLTGGTGVDGSLLSRRR